MADLHILERVWGDKQGYVFIPRWQITGTDEHGKPKGPWDEGRAFKWPDEKRAIFARVEQSANEGYEVYFCPLVFPQPRRKAYKSITKEYIGPRKLDVLWADLDEADPEKVNPRPSIAWRTSDSRASALWFLDEAYDALKVQEINKAVTYANGADKSGWDITQVLRVPGTENHKYDPPQQGRLLWAEDTKYSLEAVASMLPRNVEQKADMIVTVIGDSDEERHEALRSMASRYRLRAGTRELLLVSAGAVRKGERSEKLWELEKRLIEDGLSVAEALGLVKLSAWNKFKGRRDEDAQLLRDLLKAEEEYRASKRDAESRPLPLRKVGENTQGAQDDGFEYTEGSGGEGAEAEDDVRWLTPYDEFVGAKLQPPHWIVEGIWQEGYGMIAGEPKTFKSVTATDLAMSVASGRPFLGKFKVLETGPVVYLQRENSENTVQDRIVKIARQKGLLREVNGYSYLPPNIEIYLGNNYPIDLLDPAWRKRIEATIRRVKPKLLILDPLYMMIGDADENSSAEMNSILVWLTSLRDNYGCYSLIVHHYKKGGDGRGGQRIRGTSAFHGWVETGLYLSLAGAPNVIRMDREFRSMPSPGSIKIEYKMGGAGGWEYKPLVIEEDPGSGGAGVIVSAKKEELLSFLAGYSESKLEEIQKALNAERPKVAQWLRELEAEGRITKRRTTTGMKYKLSDEEVKRREQETNAED